MGENDILHRKTIPRNSQGLFKLLRILGEAIVPDIQAEDFLNDQPFEPSDADGKAAWHREVGVKLVLRIIDRVFTRMCEEHGELLEELGTEQEQSKEREKELQKEIEILRSKNLALEAQLEQLQEHAKENEPQQDQLKQLRGRAKEKELPHQKNDKEILSTSSLLEIVNESISEKPRKVKETKRTTEADTNTSDPVRQPSKLLKRKRKQGENISLFSKRGKSDLKPVTEIQADNAIFVPETMALNGDTGDSPKRDRNMSIPDTPEKNRLDLSRVRLDIDSIFCSPPSQSLLACHQEDDLAKPDLDETKEPPASPVFVRMKAPLRYANINLGNDVLRRVDRTESREVNQPVGKANQGTLKGKNDREVDPPKPPRQDLSPKSKVGVSKVKMISPKQQKEIDRKTWKQITSDFSSNSVPKKDSQFIDMDEEESDAFESPNLLKLKPNSKRLTKEKSEDHISVFSSPPDLPENQTKPDESKTENKSEKREKRSAAKKLIKQCENRWGLQVDDLTASQKKKLKNQRQSTLDGYFNNSKENVKKRDNDLEEALRLSKEEYEKTQRLDQGQDSSEPRTVEPEKEKSAGNKSPGFKYVGPTVRKREERAKLKGFDCPDCEEYYRAKLEEGLTEEEIETLMNKCSKHRARYKPPLTPEKFWDPEIIEGDPNSPRNKTQTGPPLRTRAVRRRENREKRRREQEMKENNDKLDDFDDLS